MDKCVVLLEDDQDLAELVSDLLEEGDYNLIHVNSVEALLVECARRSPCVALVDSTHPTEFDLWPLGPKLAQIGVPAIAFTAHSSAEKDYETDPAGFAGVVTKPFDASRFLEVVNSICWEEHQAAAS